ncbi:quinone oxidoreductase family protein [Planotetraspora kaengkrachanensis]|uniref:Quinone oxidoreductase n=1 Tax=Planotetraspora kaengkrachanensis TaxID=575193 RepID=A0A8J3Q1X5_9ACTN|nr:quinone oxidoreductase [Planotetraspora kaengkrachanensis]GIG85027.1 quinone oxidoreductase [Planotetraspora kaengkrachanensis]
MSIVIHQYAFGDAGTFTVEQENVGEPGPGEVRLRQRAIGVNYIDLAFRSGAIAGNGFPRTIGLEAAGDVEAVGPGVTAFTVGDRVTYTSAPGANAEKRLIPASSLLRLPDGVTYEQGAAMTAKGLTAGALITKAYPVGEGDVIVVHAAAGGVGSLLVRWAKIAGAVVIGTVGSGAKVAAAEANGADHVYALDSGEDVVAGIERMTNGRGADAVFDGVGRDTVGLSLRAVAADGTVALFGGASGPPALDTELISGKRITVVQPSLDSMLPGQEQRQSLLDEMFRLVVAGDLGGPAVTTYPLRDVARAHRDLESRRTTGSLVLTV